MEWIYVLQDKGKKEYLQKGTEWCSAQVDFANNMHCGMSKTVFAIWGDIRYAQ